MFKLRQIISKRSVTSLTNLESRWAKLPLPEQGAISDVLSELQKGDWRKMTLEEKRAAYYIAYGTYGPRSVRDPTLNYRVAGWVAALFSLAVVLWIKSILPKLRTRTPEWKAAEAKMMIEQKQNPYSGPYAAYLKNQEQEK